MKMLSDSNVAKHKHCVFCGAASDNSSVSAPCLSPANYLAGDTVGNKAHVYPMTVQERAKIAVEKARENFNPSDISFIYVSDSGAVEPHESIQLVVANETRSDTLKSE